MTTRITLCALALVASGAAFAKIPAPVLDDAAKAKAAEAAAKTAWQGKVDGYQLCKAQDRVAAHYKKASGGKDAKAAAAPAAGAAPATPACADPGPFVYPPPATAAAPAAATTTAAAAKAPAKKP
ncbi:hypothetical protein [Ramlibacter sp.]|uniref:hypothetical protein n=1 Tax=Ramlibacter sp. TaxID=1917967 RepID=UPI0035ADCA3B